MTFPANFTIGFHKFSQGEDDGYGNPTAPIFTPPLDQPGTPYKVFGWADINSPTSGDIIQERHRVTDEMQLWAPLDFPGAAFDRIDVEDGQFEIVGNALHHDNNPWWKPNMKTYALQAVYG